MTFLNSKIVVNVEEGNGSIDSRLERILCPACGTSGCNACWCGSGDDEPEEEAEDAAARLMHNGAMDGIESLILALACAGCITESEDPKVNQVIQSTLDACENHYS
jgi:hypothetical protein